MNARSRSRIPPDKKRCLAIPKSWRTLAFFGFFLPALILAPAPAFCADSTSPPTVPYLHAWTDANGVSHTSKCEMHDFVRQSIAPPAAPQWLDRLNAEGALAVVAVLPVGWVGEWHENPKPQWIIPLSGRWFVETMDGKRVEMGPGEISFGEDQNTKPDPQGRQGHVSGTVGNEPAVLMIIQLKDAPTVNEACHFK